MGEAEAQGAQGCAARHGAGTGTARGPSLPRLERPRWAAPGGPPLPPRRACNFNNVYTPRKVACSGFNSTRLLPASAYTSDVNVARGAPLMNLLDFSGTVNTADRTIESLRAHYYVQRSGATKPLTGPKARKP